MKTCRHFKGDRPCKYYWIDRSWDCNVCEHHNSFDQRILLIKLDALGDVVRSTPIAEGIKKQYPEMGGVFDWEYLNAPPNAKDPSEWAKLMKGC